MMRWVQWCGVTVLVLVAVGCGGGRDGILGHIPLVKGTAQYMPESGAVPGLKRVTKIRIARYKEMSLLIGESATLYRSYGATTLALADYSLGQENRGITVEHFSMESEMRAAGLFHYFRGRRLAGRGQEVAIGAAGVLDSRNKNRNLYFYKKSHFVKIIYSGPDPTPDLLPLARHIVGLIPGTSEKPRGFSHLEVQGVSSKGSYASPGYTFNADFLPAGIFAKAPGAGPIAEVFIISHHEEKDAKKTGQNYRIYMSTSGKNYNISYREQRRMVWQGVQPDVGRVIVTRYKKHIIGVMRPANYEKGEVILNRVIARIRQR